ncbi:MAG: type II toxin-antitoxin system Phd/YefM family antitoxin [Gammaproteobacteria bacterium SHHR-1]
MTRTVSMAEAKRHLNELTELALQGEPVLITRKGEPKVQLCPLERPIQPIDLAALRRLTEALPSQPDSASDFTRQMRDESRF